MDMKKEQECRNEREPREGHFMPEMRARKVVVSVRRNERYHERVREDFVRIESARCGNLETVFEHEFGEECAQGSWIET